MIAFFNHKEGDRPITLKLSNRDAPFLSNPNQKTISKILLLWLATFPAVQKQVPVQCLGMHKSPTPSNLFF